MRLGCRAWMMSCVVVAAFARIGAAQTPDGAVAFFEKSIRPVLATHCYRCHSTEAASRGKLKAGLTLDTRQGMLTGGESGPAIVPGDAKKSLLISALRHESVEMPPSGRLPAETIAHFVKWVEQGAPAPGDDAAAPTPRRTAFRITPEDRQHWSFLPVRNSPLPKVIDSTWIRDDLDRFVLARLEQAKLRPAERADRHTLLRRTTFVLTGLPPTPSEIEAFVGDDSPRAFEKVVDRLLASPEFGVHWARHWLDGVRYADSVDKSGAYRRWVVRAFTDNLPYDQFVKLQLAGDLLPAGDVAANKVHASGALLDGIAATGMLSLAVWEQVGRDLAVAEIVDSQIDQVGRHLLGLTLACARCHDHKFDPISTEDYYALAGIFFSSHIATGKLIADDRLGNDLVEVPLLDIRQARANRAIDDEIARAREGIEALSKKIPKAYRLFAVNEQLQDLRGQIEAATATAKKKLTDQAAKLAAEEKQLRAEEQAKQWDEHPVELKQILAERARITELVKTKIQGPPAVAIAEGGVPGSNRQKIGDAPVYLRGEYQREGPIVPRRFPTILAGDRQTPIGQRTKQSGRLELAEWITSPENPLTARILVNRIWQQVMGRGLVRTPDNFGRLGEKPTHPELLDHLAHRFVASGWSIKQLIRQMVLSSTFQQSSLADAEVAHADPDNRMLAHMHRRRLTYEELRDSLLFVADRLALGAEEPSKATRERRTLYEPLDRRKVNVTAAMFDGPDSKAIVPTRAETTAAPQALFLLNSPFVVDLGKRLAERITKDASLRTDEERLQRVWLVALGRPPASEEAEVALDFIDRYSWERFVQALLATNEFVYLD